jgi:hypothetical protein
LITIETETETHVNHSVLSPTIGATEDRIPLKEGELEKERITWVA